jgi:hypothetical protein
MGAGSVVELFDERYYTALDGGILESFGRLFKNDLKLYVYPLLDQKTNELVTVDNLQVAPEIRKLYEYLKDKGCIEQLLAYDPKHLKTFSRDVLNRIQQGTNDWVEHVPTEVAELIQKHSLFGYQRPATSKKSQSPAILPASSFLNVPLSGASIPS